MIYFKSTLLQFDIKGLFRYHLLLKIENKKYCSKINFKCVNSTVRPSFKENFAEKITCGFCEQCIRPTIKKAPLENTQNALPKQALN